MAKFFCCGGAHLDFTARCKAGFLPGASNPVSVAQSTGGAAGNTALNLKRLGNDVSLLSAVGDDPAGAGLLQALESAGLSTEAILRQKGQRTAAYTAILDDKGDLVAGLADMEIYGALAPRELVAALRRLPGQPQSGDFVFLDANLPAAGLAALVTLFEDSEVTLCAAAVSPAKVSRLQALLPQLDLLFCNEAELMAFCDSEGKEEAEHLKAATAISERSAACLLVTRGAEGVMLFDRGQMTSFPAPEAKVVDVNGAGDAFAAGTLHALGRGTCLQDAVALGQSAAALTLEVSFSTRESLCHQAVMERLSLGA